MATLAAVRRQRLLEALGSWQERGFGLSMTRMSGTGTPRVVVDLVRDPVMVLATCAELQRWLDDQVAASVADARTRGHSWDECGLALGVTGAAVRQRFGKGSGDG